MPSESAKKRQAQKKERERQRQKQASTKNKQKSEQSNGVCVATTDDQSCEGGGATAVSLPQAGEEKGSVRSKPVDKKAAARSCTGVLTSHPLSRDLHLGRLSITFHGVELLSDTRLELNTGRRYGLVGLNGCGKSTLLDALGSREIPVPTNMDTFQLTEEVAASDKSALQCVMEVDKERMELETEAERLMKVPGDLEHERVQDIYERLDELDSATAETKAARLLHGLGFSPEMQHRPCSDFSGGWRMRVSLARALYIKPSLLLLDEPTNHLDLEACVWLEEELKKYKRILVLVSHSQDFMNGVCTNIIHLHKSQLSYFKGNYDAYVKTRSELEEHQMKRYHWERDQMQHMKDYIARFGHGSAKLAKQAQSKEKVLEKMVAGGLAEKVVSDKLVQFSFPDCGSIPPPVMMVQNVSFRYHDDKPLVYRNVDFGVDLETRVALVGPNGAGKSTLLKLIDGELVPTDGVIRKHSHLRVGRYHQHLKDHLDLSQSALLYMMSCYPQEKEEEEMRRSLGMYGLTGKQQICPIRNLSDGQRCRVIFAWLAFRRPHLLLLDEPTNHLDMETIDALATAINQFEGGMILVSHDFRLIRQVAKEIWVCERHGIHPWKGNILEYKAQLRKNIIK